MKQGCFRLFVNCTLEVKCPSKKKKNHTAYKRWENVVHSKTEKQQQQQQRKLSDGGLLNDFKTNVLKTIK